MKLRIFQALCCDLYYTLNSCTFRRLWHEVDGARLGPEVLAGAVDPRVDALHLVGGLTEPHVPE